MNGDGTWAVVPVKHFTAAKSRLLPVLGGSARAELAGAMCEDVLDVLLSCTDVLAGTIVVTSDERAAEMARARGAVMVRDAYNNGVNSAVRQALGELGRSNGAGAMVVPADMPQLTRHAVMQAVTALSVPDVVAIAAAARDRGTNLLGCRPFGAMPLSFGPHSFDRHCYVAGEAGLALRVLDLPELSLDIDCPEDLGSFLALNTSTRTHALLARLGIVARVSILGDRRSRSNMPSEPDHAR